MPSKLTGMSRTRALSPFARSATVVLVALAALPLSGCVYGAIPTDGPTTERTEAPEPEPTETTPTTDSDLPTTLTFEDGAQLPESAYIEWGDTLMMDDNWETTSPDDGNGGWTHGTVDGTCTAQFWQGFISDIETTPGDDSVSSDAILATILQSDTETVTTHATDGTFSYQVGGNTDVEQRQLTGEQDGRVWIMGARAFTATGAGLYVIVDCTGGDANAVFAEVVEKNAVVVH